jgi:hypothetical protein
MVRTGSASVSNLDGTQWDRGLGEQSPTVRAIGLRERRNRELARSVRAEQARLRSLRARDEALFTRRALVAATAQQRSVGAVGAADDNDRHLQDRLEAMRQMQEDVWRDDLDADRVGEENFETGVDVNRRRTVRVVSGNARFQGGDAAGLTR